MKHIIALLLGLSMNALVYSQVLTNLNDPEAISDSLQEFANREVANDSLRIHRPVITDYTYWRENDLTPSIIDTTLSIENYYNQNFTQKDMFGKINFPNSGQTFNPLVYENRRFKLNLLPEGKSFNYLHAEDIRYYDVKTPMTEFVFDNGVREGQYLSTTFAHNLSPQFNYSVRYRGLRSVGFYQNNLAANNAFIATINHRTKNERFKLWRSEEHTSELQSCGHIVCRLLLQKKNHIITCTD